MFFPRIRTTFGWATPRALLLLVGTVLPTYGAPPDNAANMDFFEKKVRPILIERCYECHSVEKKTKGGLALDSRDGVQKGGDTGPVLVAGQPDKSLLIEAVRYKNHDMQMPPKKALPDAEIKVLEEWVRLGAPDPRLATVTPKKGPRVINIEEGRKHWAFRPIPPLSAPKATAPGGNPVDAFISAKLAEKGLTISPPADKRSLIRRATFDLTGLPPTPEEVDAFLADNSPEAFTKVVDRLLRSPHYGERWGRHWLDVARYADSNGMDENIGLGTAWRYRDYVVNAFNSDKPYDQFLTEQIAGDLLPAKTLDERHEHAIATGFLNLGAKVLAEADKQKLIMDVVDEQIETTGRAFLGMTLGCVRCHDHKFDPILQDDYYALAAIFKSTQSFTSEMYGAISYWNEAPLGGFEEFAAVKSAERKLELKKKEAAAAAAAAKKKPSPEAMAMADRLMTEQENIEKNLPDLPTTVAVTDSDKILPSLQIHIRGNHMALGKAVPRGFPQVMQASMAPKPTFPAKQSGRLELARWLAGGDHPLTTRVLVNRVWTWHFGQGIVATTDNFGLLGLPPSHPELLDYLARWFSNNGWSIKDLHRVIMLSATYQQASSREGASASASPNQVLQFATNTSAKAYEADPENRLLWHFPVRRLEAEEIRDAMLTAAGKIDLRIGGKTLPLRNRQFVFNHTSKDATTYDSLRRALYLPIIRNNLYDLYQQFDYPDPTVSTGLRNSTIVSPQALLLMNSGLAMDAALGFAKRLLPIKDVTERIEQAHALAFGRDATAHDTAKARDFLTIADANLASTINDAAAREQRVWSLYCQALLMANEFIYLR